MGRSSQGGLRHREGFDSAGDTHYPGSDYTYDWPGTWPSGSGPVVSTRGNFESPENWDFANSAWEYDAVNSVARLASPGSGTQKLKYIPAPLEIGKSYRITWDIVESDNVGRIRCEGGGKTGTFVSGVRSHEDVLVNVAGPTFGFSAQLNWQGAISNVRVVEVV